MEDTVSNAIGSDRCLEFEYDDHHRVLKPYILYRSQEGKVVVEGAQVDGSSDSRSMPFWRSFEIKNISSIEETDGPSSVHGSDKILPNTEEKYNPDHKRYAEIICAKDSTR